MLQVRDVRQHPGRGGLCNGLNNGSGLDFRKELWLLTVGKLRESSLRTRELRLQFIGCLVRDEIAPSSTGPDAFKRLTVEQRGEF